MAEDLNLQKGPESPPRLQMGEIGTVGLSKSDGRVLEEVKRELQWPNCINLYKTMSLDPTVYSGLQLIEMMLSRFEWDVVPPENATAEQKKKAEFIKQCMGDMEHTWEEFVQDVYSYLLYGFSYHEKVYRRRTKKAGSKYDDNLVGWRKLPIRSQDTIGEFKWSEDGRVLTHVIQDLSLISSDPLNRWSLVNYEASKIKLPVRKLLMFRYNPKRGNPLGNSPLKNIYIPWRYRTTIEEQEGIGIQRDLSGMPVLGLHPKYMSKDASQEEKDVYEYYKRIMRNLQNNEQSSIIYPLMYDDNGNKLFDFELMSVQGGKMFDTDAVIKRYDNKILMSLFADVLKLGTDAHGSFALAGQKVNIVEMAIESRFKEILSVLNEDLIAQTFEMNGWDDKDLPKFVVKASDEYDLEVLGKYIQRAVSVGAMSKDKDLDAKLREAANLPLPDYSSDKEMPLVDKGTSRSGEGQGTSGTGSNQQNNTDNNADNAS